MPNEPALDFVRVSSKRMYESVVDQIKGMINRGELKPGDLLPSERELVSRLGVSRAVLTQAFRVLEEQGLIQVRPGFGRSVRDVPSNKPGDYDVVKSLENAAIMDLLEIRDVLERKSVELACERATDADLKRIEQVLNQSDAQAFDLGLDAAFHLTVAEATHNVLLVNILRPSLALLVKTRERTLLIPGRSQGMVDEHRAIFQAIQKRDKDAAAHAVERHLNGIKTNLG